MAMLLNLCRSYQYLFADPHPEERKLVELHSQGDMPTFLTAYYQHQYRKGLDVVERFKSYGQAWGEWKALDFGCGAGGLSNRIAERCREVWGLDLDREKLKFAEAQAEATARINAHFLCYDGSQLPFEDASFDCIFCIDVIEHLPAPAHFVSEFARVLKPSGLLFLSFGPPWRHPHGKHMWAKLPGWWTHLFFPRSVVMELSGFSRSTTWEELGLHRLTVGMFESIMRRNSFDRLYLHHNIITSACKIVTYSY